MRALRQRGIERATFIASVLRWRKIRNDVISAEIIFGFRPDRGKNQANATKYKLGTKAKVQEFPVQKRSFYQTTKNTNPYATGQDPARVLPWRFPGNPMKYRQKPSRALKPSSTHSQQEAIRCQKFTLRGGSEIAYGFVF